MARSVIPKLDCAVIGGGPGGLVSALYLARFRRKVVVINDGKPRAAWIPKSHNILGQERGISGDLLLRRLRRQIAALRVPVVKGQARIDPVATGFSVSVNQVPSFIARTVILATGIEDNQPAIKNLVELRKKGLLRYCSICDAYEFRDQQVAVIAADDTGIEKALFIRHWTERTRLVIPEHFLITAERSNQLKKARIRITRCNHFRLQPAKAPHGLWIIPEHGPSRFCRVAYVELGSRIRDAAFAHLKGLRRSTEGYLVTSIEQRLSIPGLFAVGDCVNLLGQISVAAGQAAVAATEIHNDLLDWDE
ncbi:MAG TPA: NAD(P)/FAD-dependent oxidoreductase [Bdellovibrionota bacterium]|nr:NAD(P)/FAD-dependent oxidoreductase [Bdellovibrionota bacterium]